LIRGKPVYSISEIALIPLSSQEDAQKAIVRARASQQKRAQTEDNLLSDTSDDENITLPDDASLPDHELKIEKKLAEVKDKATSVAEDVIAKKGVYGRFTDRWFSKKGWTAEQRRKQGLSSEEDLVRIKSVGKDLDPTPDGDPVPLDSSSNEATGEPLRVQDNQVAPAEVAHAVDDQTEPQIPLLPKVLTTTKLFFGSKNFFFSYDYDLSRRSHQQAEPSASLSLHRSFDPMVSAKQLVLRSG
jgi:SacI-like domain-containing protein